jgi:ferredoxin
MDIVVDVDLCQGYGNCVFAAPEIFDLDPETNQAVVTDAGHGRVDEQQLADAVADCPVQAIAVIRE